MLLVLAGFAVTWSRPALIYLLHYLIRYDESKARETLLIVIRSEDGKLKIRAYMDALLAERWADIELAKKTALENKDVLAQVKFTQEAQGISLRDIAVSVEKLPGLSEALDRISTSMEDFANKMSGVAEYIARADEREMMRERYERGELPDRRHHQRQEPHPHHRTGDLG